MQIAIELHEVTRDKKENRIRTFFFLAMSRETETAPSDTKSEPISCIGNHVKNSFLPEPETKQAEDEAAAEKTRPKRKGLQDILAVFAFVPFIFHPQFGQRRSITKIALRPCLLERREQGKGRIYPHMIALNNHYYRIHL